MQNIPAQNDIVRMPHEAHVDLRNLTCADCHNQVAHPKPGNTGTEVSMAVCSMCHEQTAQPDQCEFCHIEPQAKDVHPKDYIQTHGEQALADPESCLRCHHSKAAFCDPCHAKPTPDHFSGTWRYTHGTTATKDPLGCTGLSRQGHVLRAVPPRAASERLDPDARPHRRQERRRLHGLSPAEHVRPLP